MTRYERYLKSKQWQKKRYAVIMRDDKCCRWCGISVGFKGNVHHIHYRNIFREELADLILLCPNCHTEAHSLEPPIFFADTKFVEWYGRVLEIAA